MDAIVSQGFPKSLTNDDVDSYILKFLKARAEHYFPKWLVLMNS
jgi:hypothetical protein